MLPLSGLPRGGTSPLLAVTTVVELAKLAVVKQPLAAPAGNPHYPVVAGIKAHFEHRALPPIPAAPGDVGRVTNLTVQQSPHWHHDTTSTYRADGQAKAGPQFRSCPNDVRRSCSKTDKEERKQ